MYQAVTTSPQWAHTALFITWDENGGEYDHLPPSPACVPDNNPPQLTGTDVGIPGTFNRYGFRVPLIVVSPYAKKGYASHNVYDHTSIARFIEAKFKIPALTARDANADALDGSLRLHRPPGVPHAAVDSGSRRGRRGARDLHRAVRVVAVALLCTTARGAVSDVAHAAMFGDVEGVPLPLYAHELLGLGPDGSDEDPSLRKRLQPGVRDLIYSERTDDLRPRPPRARC